MGVETKKARWVLALMAVALVVPNVWGLKEKPQPDEDGVYSTFKGVTTRAKLVHAVAAVGPQDPRLKGLKYVCALDVVIGANGIPGAMEIVNKLTTPFDDAAKAAVRQSQFEAGSFKGKPVATRLMVWVPFPGNGHPAIPVAEPTDTIKGFTLPLPIFVPEAEFSEQARRQHQGGMVLLRVLLSEEGLPIRARVQMHAENGLDGQALEALTKYRFKPALLEGVPVPMMMLVEVNFRLPPF